MFTVDIAHEIRIIATEIKFMRSEDYACLGYERNLDVMKKLNTQPVMEFIDT
jgi:hypothetical protein